MARLITVLIVLLTTEIVVTTQRFIAKAGMIARSSVELQLTKVESFDVSQSLEGRLFSYGSIAIRGSGTRTIAFQYVKNPVEFRSVCMRASQSVQPAAVVPMPEAVPAPRPTLPTTPAPVLSAFDVQIAAADGSAYSIEVRASTVDEAIARAKATGVQVVSARLKSLG